MKKIRNLIVSIMLLAWGVSLFIFSDEKLTSPKLWAAMFGMCFFGGWLLAFTLKASPDEPVEKDELTKKVGYTSLAFSAQLACLLWALAFLVDFFYPFLEEYSAFDALIVLINGMVLINLFAYLYYSKHPEKTWL